VGWIEKFLFTFYSKIAKICVPLFTKAFNEFNFMKISTIILEGIGIK
jgi:hypothetical protein